MDINAEVDRWVAEMRTPSGRRYTQVIEEALQRHIGSIRSDCRLKPGDLAALGESLSRFYRSNWEPGWIEAIVKELGPGQRARWTYPQINRFCAGLDLELPARRSLTQFLSGFSTAACFRSRFAAAYFSFDHVLIEDPVPKLFGWGNGGGFEFERYNAFRNPPVGRSASLAPTALSDEDIETLDAWLSFCSIFSADINSGRIVPVPTALPEWHFTYHRGSESDRATFGPLARVESNIVTRFLVGSADTAKLAHAEDIGLAPVIPDERVLDLFWQSHFCDYASVACSNADEAQLIANHLISHFSRLDSTANALAMCGSARISSGFTFDASSFSMDDIRRIGEGDEVVRRFRDLVRRCGREILTASPEAAAAAEIACQSLVDEFRDELEEASKESNWRKMLFKRANAAGITFLGAAGGASFGTTSVTAMIAAGFGATLPLLPVLCDSISQTRKAGSAELSMRLMLTHLT